MRKYIQFRLDFPVGFVNKLLHWLKKKEKYVLLNTNDFYDKYGVYDFLCAYGVASEFIMPNNNVITHFKSFFYSKNDWLFGFFTYDLKNELENLSTSNSEHIKMPLLHFFQPQLVFAKKNDILEIGYLPEFYSEQEINIIFETIHQSKIQQRIEYAPVFEKIAASVPKKDYLEIIHTIKNHIQKGDIYEMNYCVEFFSKINKKIEVIDLYTRLNKISPAPFSCLYKLDDKSLICASPERFLKKTAQKLISQPIKGTIKRGINSEEDKKLIKELAESEKDKSENVMIVDLVRNDISHYAEKGSVKVEELFGIYSYAQVHQMISTVTCSLIKEACVVDTIMRCFPPGSMTGAPKIKAMQIIDAMEKTKRGLYSGCVGYFTPETDFDFNVVIRSILLNNTDGYASLMAGGAITALSEPEKEYEECLIKALAMNKALKYKEE